MLLLFVHAYSLGGGTYTGIEAVSNGLPIMREPRVQTAKRTMVYMATSLAFTAAGLLLCYLLWHVTPVAGQDDERRAGRDGMTAHLPLGRVLVVVTMVSEGVLLVVAAQAGFIDGPRVLANMAVDSWVPRRFAALSDRLTTHNGIMLMGAASLVALLYTGGDVGKLVVMYSINVFLTFSLSMFGMAAHSTWRDRRATAQLDPQGWRCSASGFALCATILVITVLEKFREGGWITLLVTGAVIGLCFVIQRPLPHACACGWRRCIRRASIDGRGRTRAASRSPTARRRRRRCWCRATAASASTPCSMCSASFPNHFKNLVFISVGVIDSGGFKGADAVESLEADTEAMLQALRRRWPPSWASPRRIAWRSAPTRSPRPRSCAARSCASSRW